MPSIFSNIYKYRQKKVNQKENYLTEIFAYCLNDDETFFKSILSLWKIPTQYNSYNITTQQKVELKNKNVIPDILITLDEQTLILVEVKVDSTEREQQLADYKNIFSKNSYKKYRHQHLIFLTRDFEKPETNVYCRCQWFEIYNCITDTNQQLTKELKTYLNDEKMNRDNQFTTEELGKVVDVLRLMAKFEYTFEEVKPDMKNFAELWGDKKQLNTKRLENNFYGYILYFKLDKGINYNIGFSFWGDTPEVYADFFIPKKGNPKNKQCALKINEQLPNYRLAEHEGHWAVSIVEKIDSFISDDTQNHPKFLAKWFKKQIKEAMIISDRTKLGL